MLTCPVCQARSLQGTLFCPECSTYLLPVQPASASSRRAPPRAIVLTVLATNQQLEVRLPPKAELRLGRHDPRAQPGADVDLAPFDAQAYGVSRVHAAIRVQPAGLVLVDLGSANGTLLNGQRLLANQPRTLQPGDEIVLGGLALAIEF